MEMDFKSKVLLSYLNDNDDVDVDYENNFFSSVLLHGFLSYSLAKEVVEGQSFAHLG